MASGEERRGCAAVASLLEAGVDGELEAAGRQVLEAHLAMCARCRARRDLAARIQVALRSLPEIDAPPELIDSVLETARRAADRRARRPWRRLPAPARLLAAAALAAAILVPILRSQRPAQPVGGGADAAAVARATRETRLALAYLTRAGRRAGLEIRDGVLAERLRAPAVRGLRTIAPRGEEGPPDEEI